MQIKDTSINNTNELTDIELLIEQFKKSKRVPTVANTYDLYYYTNQKDNHKVKFTVFEKKYPKEKFDNNVKLLTRINHPNLERFLGYYEEPNLTIASIEEGQSLSSIYEKYFSKHTEDIESLEYDNDETDEDENTSNGIKKGYLTIIAYEVALGMGYLHSNKIIHRDLCSENITINYASEDGSVAKISNFANSKFVPSNYQLALSEYYSSSALSKFKAPEINSGEGYTQATDVFSYGGLLYELLTGHSPYYDKPDEIDKLISEKERPDIPDEAGEKLKKLINHCWSQESKDRPTFSEIIYYLISNHITFPGEKDNETTKQYYSKHEIKNKNIKKCLKQINKIMKLIKTAFVYEYEAQRVGTFLIRYMFYLETSEYSKNETTSNNQNDTELNKIKNQLKKLRKTVLCTTNKKWSTICLTSPVTEITEQLQQVMGSIHDSMNRLGFNLKKPYHLKNGDISFDYRKLYRIFKDLSEKKFEEEKNEEEKEEKKEEEKEEEEEEEEEVEQEVQKEDEEQKLSYDNEYDNEEFYNNGDGDDDGDDDDSPSAANEDLDIDADSTPTKTKEELDRERFESRQELIKERKSEVEKFMEDHNIEVEITSAEVDERLHHLLDNWKDWRVDRKDFKQQRPATPIGKGYSCCVFRYKRISDGKNVAVKVINQNHFKDDESFKLIRREINSLIRFKHKYFVEFIGFNDDSDKQLWIVTKLYKDKNLCNLLKSGELDNLQKTKIAFEIAQGMAFLHSKLFMHRDLKPQNVLLEKTENTSLYTPKICDLGFSKKIMSGDMSAKIGTPFYMAPEVIDGKPYGYKADVFSFGVILYEMKYKRNPYSSCNTVSRVFEEIRNREKIPYQYDDNISPDLKQLIEDCTSFEPEKRPPFDEIIRRMSNNYINFTKYTQALISDFYDKKKKEMQ